MIVLSNKIPWVARLAEVTKTKNVILLESSALRSKSYSGSLTCAKAHQPSTNVILVNENVHGALYMNYPDTVTMIGSFDTEDDCMTAMTESLKDLSESGILDELLEDLEYPMVPPGTPLKDTYNGILETLLGNNRLYERSYYVPSADEVDGAALELGSDLLDSYYRISKLPNGKVSNAHKKAAALRTIQTYEDNIASLKKRLVTMEAVRDKQIDKVKTAFDSLDLNSIAGNIVRSKEALTQEDDELGFRFTIIDDHRVELTLLNTTLTCTPKALGGAERQYYGLNDSSGLNVYWPIGHIRVVFAIGKSGVTLSYEGVKCITGDNHTFHPHINGQSLCSDNRIQPTASSCISSGKWAVLAKYMRKFLSVYNPGSPYGGQRPYEMKLPHYLNREECMQCLKTTL